MTQSGPQTPNVWGASGLFLLLWSLISFRQSFRIGIDTDHPDKLIVDGVFAFERHPVILAVVGNVHRADALLLHAHAEIVEPAEHRPLRAPSLFRQYKRISTQDYRDGRKDNSRCKLRDLFYFWCGLLLAWRRC